MAPTMLTGCRVRESVVVKLDSGVDLLLALLVFRFLTESALFAVGDVERMVTGRVGGIITCGINSVVNSMVGNQGEGGGGGDDEMLNRWRLPP